MPARVEPPAAAGLNQPAADPALPLSARFATAATTVGAAAGKLRDPYVYACAGLIALWLAAWLAVFGNIYGWLTDDAQSFYRIMIYERGGDNILDIQWFHAYMWFLMFLPWTFHWWIPSHDIPRTWSETGHFRALILYTIVLHAAFIGIVAYFLRTLCGNRAVCFAALVLFVTSPTYLLYSDLLDSRYLGLLAGVPAMIVLLGGFEALPLRANWRQLVLGFALPGFLVGVGQAVHYTELYFAGPISAVYWAFALRRWGPRAPLLQKLGAYVAGILAWFAPVQWLSLQYHPFHDSMLGTLIFQVDNHLSPYGRIADFITWCQIFFDEMGLPMIVAVVAGAVILYRDDLRPDYVERTRARLIVVSTALACVYFVLTPTYPFYRQFSGLQMFFVLFAVVAIEHAVRRAPLRTGAQRVAAAAALYAAVAFLPSVLRGPEVFIAQQGLGRAVNFAFAAAKTPARVYYMATYDWDVHPHALLSRADFDRLGAGDVLVTDYPIFYHVKYPDIFALLHDVKPAASYPTEWCTQETWAELRSYFAFRKWWMEPENCDAQVYLMSDVKRYLARRKPLRVAAVTADSAFAPRYDPSRVLALRNPALPLDDNYFGREMFDDLWASREFGSESHWVQLTFAEPAPIGAVTIVPPDFMAPPNFDHNGRVRTMRILGAASAFGPWQQLWAESGLENDAIFTATFPTHVLSRMRFVIDAQGTYADIGALEYIDFPGYATQAGPQTPPE